MPFEIITEEQLRAELGHISKFTHGKASFAEANLQAIIDHHTTRVKETALQKVVAMDELPSDLFEPKKITLQASSVSSAVKEGDVPATYFPFAVKGVAGQNVLELVDDLELRVATHPTDFYGVSLKGSKVYASPDSLNSIQLWLAVEEKLIERVASEEIRAARGLIINEAAQAVERAMKVKELRDSGQRETA